MMKRLLITGANGGLGSVCRQRLGHLADTIRLSARKGLGEAGPNEEIVYCDLGDKAAVVPRLADRFGEDRDDNAADSAAADI